MSEQLKVRKLELKEHKKTRALWESVFAEDTKAFLDYYYRRKTSDNEIYVVEEAKKIVSMLQLNPYAMRIQSTRVPSNYIIAVATKKECRSRGMMRTLLTQSMQDMYKAKQPFTFLMPAAEAIYTPYDFRYVYNQRQNNVCGEKALDEERVSSYRMTEASLEDTKKMASFAMRYLKDRYQVYTVHDEEYYLTMMLEQRAENGGVKLVWCGSRLVGIFAYAKEEDWEIREPIFLSEFEPYFRYAVYELVGNDNDAVKCYGNTMNDMSARNTKMQPMIMVRILYLQKLFASMYVKENEKLNCSFAVLDPIIHENSRVWRLTSDEKGRIIASETEDSDGVITIGALTSFLFGYRSVDEIRKEENVLIPETLGMELEKIQLLNRVFLNEVV